MKRHVLTMLMISILSGLIFSQHYTVDLESTGNSQLTILSDSITSLEAGDEIGIFDSNGILNYNDCTNQFGELLVGTGKWQGTQLEIISMGSVDLCSFGGVQISGYVEQNPVVIKLYRPSTGQIFETEVFWDMGTGKFGDIFQSVSQLNF